MKNILRKEGGFTLIELLVVILIIAILIAVAAPSFLGQTGKAHDSAAKQNLAVVYKAAKASTINEAAQGSYGTAASVVEAVDESEPQLAAQVQVSTLAGNDKSATANAPLANGSFPIHVAVQDLASDADTDADDLRAVTKSKSGRFFALEAEANGGMVINDLGK